MADEDKHRKAKRTHPSAALGVGLVTASVVVSLALLVGISRYGFHVKRWTGDNATITNRLAYAVTCNSIPGALLALLSVAVALTRVFTGEINPIGQRRQSSPLMEVMVRALQNTTEQTVAHVLLNGAMAVAVSPAYLDVVFAYTVVFALGRIVFVVAYVLSPSHRGLGMGAAFACNVTQSVYVAYVVLATGVTSFVNGNGR